MYLRGFIWVLVLSSVSAGAEATQYFVSSSGSDTNPGTSASPWQTISKVNSIDFQAGDEIRFEGGGTFTGEMYFDAGDTGTAQSPIVITSYGSGRAIIKPPADKSGFYAGDTAGITISKLDFVGAGRDISTKTGITFFTMLTGNVKLAHVQITEVEVSGFGESGIGVGGWNGSTGYSKVLIELVKVHDNKKAGIVTYGEVGQAIQDVTIRHSEVYANRGDPTVTNKSTGTGIVLGNVDQGLVERCVLHGNGDMAMSGGGLWVYDSKGVTIQHCEAYGNGSSASVYGGGIWLWGGVSSSIIQYNYVHDNVGPGLMLAEWTGSAGTTADNVVRYNISQDDGVAVGNCGIRVQGGGALDKVEGAEIYGNTVYASGTAPASTAAAICLAGSDYTKINVRNNLFVAKGGVRLVRVETTGEASFSGNGYWSGADPFVIRWGGVNYSSLAAWRTASGQEQDSSGKNLGFEADPLLTNPGGGKTLGDASLLATLTAYQLLAGSPAVDTGLDLKALYPSPGAQDFYGNSIPLGAGFDVGAHERPPPPPDGGAPDSATPDSGAHDGGAPVDGGTDMDGGVGPNRDGAGGEGWLWPDSDPEPEDGGGHGVRAADGCGCVVGGKAPEEEPFPLLLLVCGTVVLWIGRRMALFR